jgi:hypothetical protein
MPLMIALNIGVFPTMIHNCDSRVSGFAFTAIAGVISVII